MWLRCGPGGPGASCPARHRSPARVLGGQAATVAFVCVVGLELLGHGQREAREDARRAELAEAVRCSVQHERTRVDPVVPVRVLAGESAAVANDPVAVARVVDARDHDGVVQVRALVEVAVVEPEFADRGREDLGRLAHHAHDVSVREGACRHYRGGIAGEDVHASGTAESRTAATASGVTSLQ